MLTTKEGLQQVLDTAESIVLPAGIKKPNVALVKDAGGDFGRIPGHLFYKNAYWPRYERFLVNNQIPYAFVDIHRSGWQELLAGFDALVWRVDSNPTALMEAKTKLSIAENLLNIKCLPSGSEVWHYEDKGRIHELLTFFGFPLPPTLFSFSKQEALDFIEACEYPLISKILTGSASKGVSLIKSAGQARSLICKAFGRKGRKTYWPQIRQKGYVYLQEYIKDARYDLRVIVIGNKFFGYYKWPRKGRLFASGSGRIEKKGLPAEAMMLALRVKECLGAAQLAVDFLYSEKQRKYLIIEVSVFIQVSTSEQLHLNGIAGYYLFNGRSFSFVRGRYWLQEVALAEFFKENFSMSTLITDAQ